MAKIDNKKSENQKEKCTCDTRIKIYLYMAVILDVAGKML